jgi:hypothetical protein
LLLVGQIAAQPSFVQNAAHRAGKKPEQFAKTICNYSNDKIAERVFREYGAVFVADESATVPGKCVFESTTAVVKFHSELKLASAKIGSTEITLQAEAMRALLEAIGEASAARLRITPLDGSIAGTRDYDDTVRLWNSRFYRALDYWQRRGRISKTDADAARALSAYEQVPLVLAWEERGLLFSTGFNRSILTSVAPPGTSQHLSGLAFDVVEYRDSRVRTVLNKHGWFQTVLADEPHFTYLGRAEIDLPTVGLISTYKNGYKFWIPAIR